MYAAVVTRSRLRAYVAVGIACAGFAGCIVWAALSAQHDRLDGLSVLLLIGAVCSGLGAMSFPGMTGTKRISAAFIVDMLAATFLGVASAFVMSVVAELATARTMPTRKRALIINLFGSAAPALAAATVMRDAAPHDHRSATFYLLLAVVAFGALVMGWVIVASLFVLMDGNRGIWTVRDWRNLLPVILINVALAAAGAAIYVELGLAGIIFAFVALVAFSYQARLVAKAEQRSEQYVSLSWGVLAGLLRSLDMRDRRAARHAAAVARFSRDIAMSVGMDKQQQELAHPAGLLHDIGHFALSDRVHERGRTLTEEDWVAIQRHPELGADMLRDLGMYGPVAEIVLAHHERLDGRGYPRGRTAEEIPEIAKIIAVAEVYDTLTASDTYRTRQSSFEALNELRRVAGSQLDPKYVEVLAALLTGEGVEYRHADAADFDSELDMERRIREAAAT
jgi:putative nucleotidyltransferase with HDIG domain